MIQSSLFVRPISFTDIIVFVSCFVRFLMLLFCCCYCCWGKGILFLLKLRVPKSAGTCIEFREMERDGECGDIHFTIGTVEFTPWRVHFLFSG